MKPRRILLVSPHFPPDPNAGAHRARLLGRHLPAFGWTPTVLTAAPSAGEPVDDALAALVSRELEVVRVPVWSRNMTRALGFGDLGLRSLAAFRREGTRLLAGRDFDAVFITLYPVYPAVLGPMWYRRFGVPFVIDYQDPWVGSWGVTVGGSEDGSPDLRSRLSRQVGLALEPRVLRRAAGVTAVSEETCQALWRRYPALRKPSLGVPIGAEPDDFLPVRTGHVSNPIFQRDAGLHVCYVGTVLPNGRNVVDALLAGLRILRARNPDLARRLHVHFVGSSNRTDAAAVPLVTAMAAGHGVADLVREHPARVPYLEALAVLNDADVVLALGSTEAHYSPSKLYPCLLARRPLLAIYREGSDPAAIVGRIGAGSDTRKLLTIGETVDVDHLASRVAETLPSLMTHGRSPVAEIEPQELDRWSARAVTRRVAEFLDDVIARKTWLSC